MLLGREEPPFDAGIGTLMEYASAAMGRALEMSSLIREGERNGLVDSSRGSTDPWYKFRVGDLRDFIDLFKNAFELGSRRITQQRNEYDMDGGSI